MNELLGLGVRGWRIIFECRMGKFGLNHRFGIRVGQAFQLFWGRVINGVAVSVHVPNDNVHKHPPSFWSWVMLYVAGVKA